MHLSPEVSFLDGSGVKVAAHAASHSWIWHSQERVPHPALQALSLELLDVVYFCCFVEHLGVW